MPRHADWPRWRCGPDPTLRIGDAERNAAADALSQHYSAGRLDDAELKERLDRAMSARTGADLGGLMADLPPLDPATPQSSLPVRRQRHLSGLWIVLCVVLVLAALGHGPAWWPWWAVLRIPWLVVAGIALVLWRRARRRRWRPDVP